MFVQSLIPIITYNHGFSKNRLPLVLDLEPMASRGRVHGSDVGVQFKESGCGSCQIE